MASVFYISNRISLDTSGLEKPTGLNLQAHNVHGG